MSAKINIIVDHEQANHTNVQVYSQTPAQEAACDCDVLESRCFTSFERAAAYADKLSRKYKVEWQSN